MFGKPKLAEEAIEKLKNSTNMAHSAFIISWKYLNFEEEGLRVNAKIKGQVVVNKWREIWRKMTYSIHNTELPLLSPLEKLNHTSKSTTTTLSDESLYVISKGG